MSTAKHNVADDLRERLFELGRAARAAAAVLAQASPDVKRGVLEAAADDLRRSRGVVLAANAEDIAAAKSHGLSAAMIDRLALDDKRIEATAAALETVAALDDPVGQVIAEWQRETGGAYR